MKKNLLFGALAAVAMLVVGCNDGDTAGDKMERGAEKTGDAIETGADKTGDAIENAGDKTQDALK
ncbi:MAG TPA: YtxH domain-containing protein [Planctomycetota bacterium]|nr:YtxH domain-containing protein [Planctomycetota bacterium]